MKYVVFDIDGTISDCSHRIQYAHSKQWDEFHQRCLEDPVIVAIADLLLEMDRISSVILLTGRSNKYRYLTDQWLVRAGLYEHHDILLMRPDNDWRPDHEMKIALLENSFGSKNKVLDNVWLVIDDRDSVVEGLRNYGLTVLQPAAGGF